MTTLAEADVEQATLECLSRLGLNVSIGPGIAPDMPIAERDDCGRVFLDRPQFRPRRTDSILSGEALAALSEESGRR